MKVNKDSNTLDYLVEYSGLILILILGIIALFTFQNYGISWDEVQSRLVGTVSFEYVFQGNNYLLNFWDKDYGTGFELPLVMVEKFFNINDTRNIFLMRHLLTHSFFLFGAFCFYQLVYLLFSDRKLAAIGLLMFVINPVIYSHSFYNSKDIPFLSLVTVCLYFAVLASYTSKKKYFILLAVLIGLLLNIRIGGILIVPFFFIYLFIKPDSSQGYLKQLSFILFLVLISALTLFLTWPYLWVNPFKNFYDACIAMSRFIRWSGEVLVAGVYRKSTNIGWDYFSIYFGVSNPILYLFLGVSGILLIIFQFIKKPILFFQNPNYRSQLFFLLCFLTPVLSVVLLKSILYDSWRHLFFVYPAFILIAINFLKHLLDRFNPLIIYSLILISFVYLINFMAQNYPNQHVYFNQLVSHKPEYIRHHFEQDYWGNSFNEALDFVLKTDNSDSIKVNFNTANGVDNTNLLSPKDRSRIKVVPLDEASYFITTYRWHPDDYLEYKGKSVFTILIGNSTVLEVFKIK